MSTSSSHSQRRAASLADSTNGDALALEILTEIRRILRKTTEHSRQLVKVSGLTVPQILVLRVLADASSRYELTGVQVAEAVQLSPATVSRILDRLEDMGYIHRTRHPADRRRVLVAMTVAGRRKLRKLPTPLHEEFLEQLQELAPARQRDLLKSLKQLVAMLGATGLDAAPMLTPDVEMKPPGR